MRISEVLANRLNETILDIDEHRSVNVVKNLGANQLLSFAKQSNGKLRGLVDGSNVYWWEKGLATHGEVAKAMGYDDYVDNRLFFTIDDEGDGFPAWIDDDYTKLPAHPQFRSLMRSNRILFDAGSWGDLPGPEFATHIGL